MKKSGTGVQGHQREPAENAKAALQTYEHMKHGLSFNEAVKAAATAEIASPSTIRAAVTQFLD